MPILCLCAPHKTHLCIPSICTSILPPVLYCLLYCTVAFRTFPNVLCRKEVRKWSDGGLPIRAQNLYAHRSLFAHRSICARISARDCLIRAQNLAAHRSLIRAQKALTNCQLGICFYLDEIINDEKDFCFYKRTPLFPKQKRTSRLVKKCIVISADRSRNCRACSMRVSMHE